MRELLGPKVNVVAHVDQFEFFQSLFARKELPLPPIVVNGLDDVGPRRAVQRMWPAIVIDMATGELTAQVLVKRAGRSGRCLLGAYPSEPGEVEWYEELARRSGLGAARIRDEFLGAITSADVDVTMPQLKEELERARRKGRQVCGRIMDLNLDREESDPDFASAAPFVSAFAGILGAGETLKRLMENDRDGVFCQAHRGSARIRGRATVCQPDCECVSRSVRSGDCGWPAAEATSSLDVVPGTGSGAE